MHFYFKKIVFFIVSFFCRYSEAVKGIEIKAGGNKGYNGVM